MKSDSSKTKAQLIDEIKDLRKSLSEMEKQQTEREDVEKTLQFSEESYHNLIEQASDGIFIADKLGRFIEVNRSGCEMLGYSLDEILKLRLSDIITKESLKEKPLQFDELATGKPMLIEQTLIRKDGDKIPVEVSAKMLENGNFQGIVRDITKREEAKKKLFESERRYRDLVETSQDLIWRLDDDGRFTYLNDAWEVTLGYKSDEMLGKRFTQFKEKSLVKKDLATYKSIVKGGQVSRFETIYMSKTGEPVYLQFNARPKYDLEGKIVGTQGTAFDITDRKKVEEALRDSEERYRNLFHGMPVALYRISRDGGIIDTNSAALEILGYPDLESFKRIKIAETYVDMGKRDEWIEIIERDDSVQNIEFQVYRHDGSIIWVQDNARAVRDEDGKVVYYEGSLVDVTERKQVENALRESEEKFKSLAEQSPNMIFINKGGKVVYANEKCEEVTGYTKDELYSPSFDFFVLIAPEHIGIIRENYTKHIKGEEVSSVEYGLITKEGKRIEAIINTRLIKYERETAILGVITDITERKQAEEELNHNHDLLEAIASIQTEFISEKTTHIIYDKLLEKLLHLSESEFGFIGEVRHRSGGEPYLVSYGISNIAWNEETKKYYNKSYERGMEFANLDNLIGEVMKTSERVISNNPSDDPRNSGLPKGHPPLNSFMGLPLYIGGEMIGILGVANRPGGYDDEVAEYLKSYLRTCANIINSFKLDRRREESEEERRKLRKKLKRAERLESLGVLAGGVAHDLNNILGPVLAYPDLIMSDLPLGSTAKGDLMEIKSAALKASDVINDLLTLARRGKYEMVPLNLNDVVTSYVNSSGFKKARNENRGVNVNIELADDLFNIPGSDVHLSKVIMNVVNNAFQSLEYGGNFRIRTLNEYVDRRKLTFDEIPEGEYVVFEVEDEGIGISKKGIDRIFDPFYTTKRKAGGRGTGLGLSVVHGVVKDHDGYIGVESEMGKGTKLAIYFPITREDSVGEVKTQADYSGSESILVVDDIEEQIEIVKKLLTPLGYYVEGAIGGRKAVEKLRKENFDLVLLDMIMEEGFDGLDSYKEMIKIKANQKAIVVSGFSETDRVKEAIKLGVGRYIRKPYTRETLSAAIREELDKKD